jgi:uncharacterized alkaline shock family protein YloU
VEGRSLISTDVLTRYAADAAREVDGVAAVGDGGLQRGKGVVVSGDVRSPAVTLHVDLAWGRSASQVGAQVQARVGEYLERMADVRPASVDVVVSGVGSPPAKR